MTREEAVEIYLSKYGKAAEIVEKIMAWDTTKTIEENMKNLSFLKKIMAYQFSRKFNLKYAKHRKAYMRKVAFKAMREAGATYEEIGRLFSVSKQAIEQVIKNGARHKNGVIQ